MVGWWRDEGRGTQIKKRELVIGGDTNDVE